MALQPSLHPLVIVGANSTAPHTIEVFVDYVCPFSNKIAHTLENVVKPLIAKNYSNQIKIIIRNQVQPWHATSTLVHEASLAVARVSPEHFWPFSLALFKAQENFYDIPASKKTPLEIRQELADLAATIIPAGQVEAFKELLKLKSTPNGGVDVTNDLKYTIKYSRQNGIHVSPTVLFDGLIADQISSGWGEKEWSEFLASKI